MNALGRLSPRLAVAALLMLGLSGCKVALRVGVEADERGGGEVEAVVTLDKDAQAYVGDLRGKLRTSDLTEAGWTVTGPATLPNGDVRVTARKPFVRPSQVDAVVSELDGAKGLFEDFRVTQSRSFFKTDTRFTGRVDLRRGIEAFSDETLRQELGSPLGATPEEYSQRIGMALADAIPITVGVRLPGDLSSNAPQSSGGAAAWHPRLGERVELSASATHWNLRGIGLAAVSVVAGTLGVISALRRRRRRGRATAA